MQRLPTTVSSTPQNAIKLILFTLSVYAYLATMTAASPLAADGFEALNLAPQAENKALPARLPGLSATLPPSDFTVIPVDTSNRPILDTIVFRLTIFVLAVLAMAPRLDVRFHAKQYPVPNTNVLLGVGGPGAAFYGNYTVWGLTMAAKYMVDNNAFRSGRFMLHWEYRLVGDIRFAKGSGISSIEANSTTDDLDLSRSADLAEAQLETSTRDLGAMPAMEFRETRGAVLSLNEAMMVIVGAFSDIAFHDSAERIPSNVFTSAFPPYRGNMLLSFQWPPGSAPDWYTYKFLILLLQRLTSWYNDRAVRRPLQIFIREPNGGPVVGQGHFAI
ncbi:MAG: hypothetical protein LQ346_004058 [Caloplaca aetnensis]|nr:MAG: hypothetical protein LQ346_004058 [Caloplaca aetnensis]